MTDNTNLNERPWQLFVDGTPVAISSAEQELLEQARTWSINGKVVTRELWVGNVIKEEFSLELGRFVRII